MDTSFPCSGGRCLLRWLNGSRAVKEDFQPHVTELAAGQTIQQAPNGGRPTDGVMPFWNFQWTDRGVIAALGWPGQWAATFARHDVSELWLRAGLCETVSGVTIMRAYCVDRMPRTESLPTYVGKGIAL